MRGLAISRSFGTGSFCYFGIQKSKSFLAVFWDLVGLFMFLFPSLFVSLLYHGGILNQSFYWYSLFRGPVEDFFFGGLAGGNHLLHLSQVLSFSLGGFLFLPSF